MLKIKAELGILIVYISELEVPLTFRNYVAIHAFWLNYFLFCNIIARWMS